MSDNRNVAKTLLMEAGQTILKSRPGIHGSAEQSFEMIGDLWTVYLRHLRRVRSVDSIQPQDVAQMMVQMKQARSVYGDATNPDNFVDGIGYTALAGMLQLPDPEDKRDADTRLEQELRVDEKQPELTRAAFPTASTEPATIRHKHTNINTGMERSAEEILRDLYRDREGK